MIPKLVEAQLNKAQKEILNELDKHLFRIGDITFFVPPTSIVLTEARKNNKSRLIRSNMAHIKETGFKQKGVNVSLFFVDAAAINDELRPLLSMSRKFPFLPIKNHFLNETLNITEVIVKGISLATVPGFPSSLQATLSLEPFYANDIINDPEGRSLDEMIDWKLFNWNYMRSLDNSSAYTAKTYHMPLVEELSNQFLFEMASTESIEAIREWRRIRNATIYGKRNNDKFIEDKGIMAMLQSDYSYEKFKKNYKRIHENVVNYEDIEYEPYEFPSLVMTGFTIQVNHNISTLPFEMSDRPMPQYLGAKDVNYVIEFETTDEEDVAMLNALWETSSWQLREFNDVISNGTLRFNTQFTKLMGSTNVAIDNVQITASNAHTGVYRVEVVLTAFDRFDRRMTEVSWLNSSIKNNWTINAAKDKSFLGYMWGMNPMSLLYGTVNKGQDILNASSASDAWYKFTAGGGPLGILNRPVFNVVRNLDDQVNSGRDIHDLNKSIEYEQSIKQIMNMTELYPDLDLPTYDTLKINGFNLPNPSGAIYPDPDFFIKYAKGASYVEAIASTLNQEFNDFQKTGANNKKGNMSKDSAFNIELEDGLGGTTSFQNADANFKNVPDYGHSFDKLHAKKKEYIDELDEYDIEDINEEEAAEGAPSKKKTKEAKLKITKSVRKNISHDEAEYLIRKYASELIAKHQTKYPMYNQDIPLSIARVSNRSLQQYYQKGDNIGISPNLNVKDNYRVVGFQSSLAGAKAKKGEKPARQLYPIGMTVMGGAAELSGGYIGIMKISRRHKYEPPVPALYIPHENIKEGVKQVDVAAREVEKILSNKTLGTRQEIINRMKGHLLYKLKKSDESIKHISDSQVKHFAIVLYYLGQQNQVKRMGYTSVRPLNSEMILLDNTLLLFTYQVVIKESIRKSYKEWNSNDFKSKANTIKMDKIDTKESILKKQAQETKNAPTKKQEEANKNADKKIEELQMQRSGLQDMLNYDRRGRLVRCFPTYFLTFIDEGGYVGNTKLADNFFNYNAVEDIMYVNNRKDASSTLYLNINNMNGNLSDNAASVSATRSSTIDVMRMLLGGGGVAKDIQSSRNEMHSEGSMRSVMLATGTRVHFRMGYGSSVTHLPTIMNGTITSIENNEATLSIMVQDDGIELASKLKVKPGTETDNGWLSNKQEPTQIVDELLNDSGSMFKSIKKSFSRKAQREHSLGIKHFGLPSSGDLINGLSLIEGTAVAGSIIGVAGLAGGPIGLAIATPLALTGVAYGININSTRKMNELNMNVHPTSGMNNEQYAARSWMQKALNTIGMGDAEETNVNISLFDKSVWDVLNICASMGDDHVVAVHPFGFRNTIFSGKPTFPIIHDYAYDAKTKKVSMVSKQFRQIRIYDSMTSILSNKLESSERNMFNVATGIYMDKGEMTSTPPIYLDKNIWTDKQKNVNIDTTTNAKGLWGVGAIPLIGGILNKPAKWYFDEAVAIKIATSGLRDHVKEMYGGYISLIGDPSTKPFDFAWIDDDYNNTKGPIEIEEVVHMMNYDTGFTTMIKPDVIVVSRDINQVMSTIGIMKHIGTSIAATFLMRLAYTRLMKVNPTSFMTHALWTGTKKAINMTMNPLIGAANVTGSVKDKLLKKSVSPEQRKAINEARYKRYSTETMIDKLKDLKNRGLNINESDMSNFERKLRQIGSKTKGKIASSSLISSLMDPANLKRTRKVVRHLRKVSWVAAINPVGLLVKTIEASVVAIGGSVLRELIERNAYLSRACIVVPIKQRGFVLTSGMNGAGASIVGRANQKSIKESIMTSSVVYNGLKFLLDVDTRDLYAPSEEHKNFYNDIVGKSLKTEEEQRLFSYDNIERAYELVPYIKEIEKEYPSAGIRTFDQEAEIFAKAIEKNVITRTQPAPAYESIQAYEDDVVEDMEAILEKRRMYDMRSAAQINIEHIVTRTEKWFSKAIKGIKDFFSDLWSKIKGLFSSNCGGSNSDQGNSQFTEFSFNGKFARPSSMMVGKNRGHTTGFKALHPIVDEVLRETNSMNLKEVVYTIIATESSWGTYESNGYPDIMQSSESAGFALPNMMAGGVKASVRQGIKHLKSCINLSKGMDPRMALQSYNMGGGFSQWARSKGYTQWSKKIAQEFQCKMKPNCKYGNARYIPDFGRYWIEGGNQNDRIIDDTDTIGSTGADKDGGEETMDDICVETSGSGGIGTADCSLKISPKGYTPTLNLNRIASFNDSRLISLTASNMPTHFYKTGAVGFVRVRKELVPVMEAVGREWKKRYPNDRIGINSTLRVGDTYWHSTGYALDIHNNGNSYWSAAAGGFVGLNANHTKRNVELAALFIEKGFRGVYYNDVNATNKLKTMFPAKDYLNFPYITEDALGNHYHHLHFSYLECKK